MYVEEIIIDGFKSYAVRTTLKDFSPHFNAITGLNGSGKSNVLDAICFVLGLSSSNLQQVRAQSLNDLVYKKGQAGVVRASVSIVFKNDNKDQSPVGFEKCDKITVTRQIVIGGKNKYMVNGSQAHQNTVQNLFQSVQLNINNPHFLIMQGRITKVLNMKPVEILSLIEEAAGTRMFEEKKEKALKTIEKKEAKVVEINELMDKDIAPKLDKLKKEKQDFLNFQKIESEVERLKRLLIAFDFYQADGQQKQLSEQISEINDQLQQYKSKEEDLEGDIKFAQESIQELNQRKDQELKKSSKFKALQETVASLSSQLTRLSAQKDIVLKSIKDEEKSIAELIKATDAGEKQLAAMESKVMQSKTALASDQDSLDGDIAAVKKQENLLQTLTTGVADSEGQDSGYADQLNQLKVDKSKVMVEVEDCKQRLQYLNSQLATKKPQAKEAEKANKSQLKQLETLKAELSKLEAERQKSVIDESLGQDLKSRKQEKIHEIRKLQQEIDNLSGQLANFDFKYADPHSNFDRKKVRGLVGQLIKLQKENLEFCTALQICAEGRLYFVVVEDNKVASDLLKNGKLQKKHTFIPLKQIVPPNIAPERVQRSKQLAPGKVESALDLLQFQKDVEPAMKFVFGGTLICKDAEAAKLVTYDSKVRLRTITVDGDVYEPGATITGGSSPTSNNILEKLYLLSAAQDQLNKVKFELKDINDQIEQFQQKLDLFNGLDSTCKRKQNELKNLDDLIKSSTAGRLISEVLELEQNSQTLKGQLATAESKVGELDKQIKSVELEMREFDSNRDGQLKKIEKTLASAKKALVKKQADFKLKKTEHDSLLAEFEQMMQDRNESMQSLEEMKTSLASQESELKNMISEIQALKTEYDTHNKELQKQSKVFLQFDKDIAAMQAEVKQKQSMIQELHLNSKKHSIDLGNAQKTLADAQNLCVVIEKEHEWVADQKGNFGKPNTAFDFSRMDASDCSKKLTKLQAEYEVLRKKINVKVMNMIDRVVQKEQSLKQMLATVRKDKEKIEETIQQLDHYKREALQRTWQKVNGDFGAIFNDLLPGNTAKLDPVEGQTIYDGLEVKVRLGKVWKQSLTELSGGQRSLVALSLILSLLQFKPAPMYILDEIDAALDLSHTQNIGHLFKNRFKGSQFIVVSLKEGMFNNADVLFRARFRDGTSVVERFTQQTVAGSELPVASSSGSRKAATSKSSKKNGGGGGGDDEEEEYSEQNENAVNSKQQKKTRRG
ncbi:hypothetical protein MP228_006401 [Amoeboaphelidium protococcarum]|nr:hypothetical protein MP228_006401 [Amoeboaphelidium protococcarum]